MKLDEFSQILDTYGSHEANWPKDVLTHCQELLAKDVEAQALLATHSRLDEQLQNLEIPVFAGLEQRVLNQPLPERQVNPIDKFISWLLPLSANGTNLWRPVAVACLPLVMGVAVSNFYTFGITAEADGFQYWDDELLMLSFNDYSEIDSAP